MKLQFHETLLSPPEKSSLLNDVCLICTFATAPSSLIQWLILSLQHTVVNSAYFHPPPSQVALLGGKQKPRDVVDVVTNMHLVRWACRLCMGLC